MRPALLCCEDEDTCGIDEEEDTCGIDETSSSLLTKKRARKGGKKRERKVSSLLPLFCASMREEEDTCGIDEEEDTCDVDEEEDTCGTDGRGLVRLRTR